MTLRLRFPTAPPVDRARGVTAIERAVALAVAGRRLALADASGRVRVLRCADGAEELVVDAGRDARAVALDPTGSRLAVGVRDRVRVFDVSTGDLLAERVVPGGVRAVTIGADGRVAAGGDSAATWVDTADGWGRFVTHQARILAIDRVGDTVVTGGADAQVAWTDLASGRATLYQGHVDAVTAVRILGDHVVLSGSADGSVRRWDGPTGELLHTWRALPGPVVAVAAVADRVVAGGLGRDLAVLGPEGPVGVLAGHARGVVGLGAAADGTVWSAGRDRTLRRWDVADAAPAVPLTGHRDGVRACHVRGDTGWTGGRDGTARAWDLTTGAATLTWRVGPSAVQAMLVGPGGRLFTAAADGTLAAAGADGRRRWSRAPAHGGPVTCLGWLPDAGLLLSGGADGALRLWDPDTGSPVAGRTDHPARLRCLAVAPDGRVASGGYDGRVVVAEPLGGAARTRPAVHEGPVVGVAWSGGFVVSGGLDGALVHEAGPRAENAHPEGVVGLIPLPGGGLVSAGLDGHVRQWTAALEPVASLDLGVPLDGLGGGGGVVLVGDRRGGVHVIDV